MTTAQDARAIDTIRAVTAQGGNAPSESAWPAITAQDEKKICKAMPTMAECIKILDAPFSNFGLVEFEKYRSLALVGEAVDIALIETDPTFEAAYFCQGLALATFNEIERGVSPCSAKMLPVVARIALRCHLYMFKRLREVRNQAKELRDLMSKDTYAWLREIKDHPPSAPILAALTAPDDNLIRELHGEKKSVENAGKSKARRADVSDLARKHYFDLVKENKATGPAETIAHDILLRIAKEGFPKTKNGVDKKLAPRTLANKIGEWKSEIK
jgi:hypothetical protein